MHHRPDADALGSSLGLASFLRKGHHQVSVIAPTPYPNFLAWMPGSKDVIIFCKGNKQRSFTLLEEADLVFCLDFSVPSRIDEMGEVVKNASGTTVVIDHHLEPQDFTDFIFWDPHVSATAELVYTFIEQLGEKERIDKDIAECLYAGIMTDTGSFKYPNTTTNSHLVTAALMDRGADVAHVSRLIYENNSLDKLQFISFAIIHRLVILEDYRTAYFAISKADFQKFKLKKGDTEGLVNYALSLKNIILAALITEKEDHVRISFRSRKNFSVNNLAKAYFEGGGHKNAAGGNSRLTLKKTVEKFEHLVKENEKALLNA